MEIKLNYGTSFTNLVNRHLKSDTNTSLSYTKTRLTNALIRSPIDDWLREALTHRNDRQRIEAIQKVGRWGTRNYEIIVLTHLYQSDPNLELREEAAKAINQIRTRQQY